MLRLFLTVGLPARCCLATPSAGPSTEGCERRIPSISSERTISEELKEAVEQEQKKKPAAKPVSDPVQTPEPDISPTEALFGPESSGTAPGAFHNAQDEAMLFYEDDDDES